MKANLSQREPQIQKIWDEGEVYRKMLEKNKEGEPFILHDGPPYANGNIHLGHAINRVLKDIVVKLKSMEGYYTPFVPGWDCHGLPVEYELMKSLGRREVEDKLKFRKKAARYALKYVGIQKKEFKRLGVFGDWENPYLTLDSLYEKTIIEKFRDLFLSGYIYRELKPVYWCGSCKTALAEAEVEYDQIESPSIYVKFEMLSGRPSFLEGGKRVYALVWTTTPWTLISNTAVCFHPDYKYSVLTNGEEYMIVASHFSGKYEGWREERKVTGKTLAGCLYKAPFGGRKSRGITSDFVSLDEGTGVVHIAPGHGEEDYSAGKKYSLQIISPVDKNGQFTKDAGVEEVVGMSVFDADKVITEILNKRGALYAEEKINHSYPHCWRCKKPVIFRATKQWFLNVDKDGLRKKVLEEIENVRWYPDISRKRISSMIENRPHWCLSRQRLWGVPVPVFYCGDCGEMLATKESFDSIARTVEKEGSDAWFYRSPEEILGVQSCSCGSKNLYKEEDILDVWFDSGVSSFAVLRERESLRWPADIYMEGSDQHRGWFQTSIIPSVALHGKAPYRNVLTHGFTVDEEGRKMSKSVGNVISPQEIIQKYGADLLRLWAASENYFKDVKISDEILQQMVTYYRRIRNTLRFVLGNTKDLPPSEMIEYENLSGLDKFILAKLKKTAEKISQSYENLLFYKGVRILHDFCNGWLSSFYFNILKDRLYVLPENDRVRRSSQTALVILGEELMKLAAPVLSHTAEEGWQKMIKERKADLPESVFLSEITRLPEKWDNTEITKDYERIARLRETVLRQIEKAKEKGLLKDPLESKVTISTNSCNLLSFLNEYKAKLKEYFIVSEVEIKEAEPEEGKKFSGEEIDVNVSLSEGKKCVRCWMKSKDIGKSSRHPEICGRCIKIVSRIKK